MLLDVSQPVTAETACFPGDVPFSCGWTARIPEGASVNVAWVRMSPHVGTHVDAPFHYDEHGGRVGTLDPGAFIGGCHVIDARGRDALDADLLDGLDLENHPRVLFRTQERTHPDRFLKEFPLLTPRAIDRLARARVRLVGIDAPSYDAWDAKDLAIHKALGRHGIANVENLRLDEAPSGRYEMLAPPVLWTDLDAAPLRAILRV